MGLIQSMSEEDISRLVDCAEKIKERYEDWQKSTQDAERASEELEDILKEQMGILSKYQNN